MDLSYMLVLRIVTWLDCVCENSEKWKRVSFIVCNLYLNISDYETKQENLSECRHCDKFNETLNVPFILGAFAERESMSFEDIGGTEGQA